jgi:hypothetical protein
MQDGTNYLPPGGGISSSGLGIHDVIETDKIFAVLKSLESNIVNNI